MCQKTFHQKCFLWHLTGILKKWTKLKVEEETVLLYGDNHALLFALGIMSVCQQENPNHDDPVLFLI